MRIQLNKSRGRNLAGTSLIEAVVAMGIFGVSFFSLYAGMSMGFSIIGNARENLRATQVMVEKMETIRLYSWEQINTPGFIPATFTESYYPAEAEAGGTTSGGTTSDGVIIQTASAPDEGGTSTGTSNGITYRGQVAISDGPGGTSYSGDMKRVTISVNWTAGGRNHNRSMNTFVTRHGLQNYIY